MTIPEGVLMNEFWFWLLDLLFKTAEDMAVNIYLKAFDSRVFFKKKLELFTSFNISSVLFIGIIFITLTYLSIPYFYNTNKFDPDPTLCENFMYFDSYAKNIKPIVIINSVEPIVQMEKPKQEPQLFSPKKHDQLFWSIYVLFEGPRQKSDRGSSKHSGSLLWSIWICRGPPPPLLIRILVNLLPPPHHWALLWSIYCLSPPLIPVMVNISSIGDCGVIIQLYSLYIAPVMVNSSSLGCSNVISLPVVVNICTNPRKLFDHNTTQQIHSMKR